MMRARGWVLARQRIRPPISSRNSTRRSMLFSPIPRWKRGLQTLATRRLQVRQPSSASSSPRTFRNGPRCGRSRVSGRTDRSASLRRARGRLPVPRTCRVALSRNTPAIAIMPRRWRKLLGCLALVFGLAAAAPAAAHGFGQRYDLPLPVSFYIWGAGATVALSFVGFALFLRTEHGLLTWHIDCQTKGRLAASLAAAPRALASGMLLLVIVAGLFGNQDPIRNIAAGHDLDRRLGGTGGPVGPARRCVEADQSMERGFRARRAM